MKKFLLFLVFVIIIGCSSPFDLEVPPYPVEIIAINGFPPKIGDVLTAHIPSLNETQKKKMEIEYEWYRNNTLIIGRKAGGDEIAPVSKSDNTYKIFDGDSFDNMDTGSIIYVKAIYKHNKSESKKVTILPTFEGIWNNPANNLTIKFNEENVELTDKYKGKFSHSDTKLILVFTHYYSKVPIEPACDCETKCECEPECKCEPDYEYIWLESQPNKIITATIDYELSNDKLDLLNNTLENEVSLNGSWVRQI